MLRAGQLRAVRGQNAQEVGRSVVWTVGFELGVQQCTRTDRQNPSTKQQCQPASRMCRTDVRTIVLINELAWSLSVLFALLRLALQPQRFIGNGYVVNFAAVAAAVTQVI